MIKLIMRNDMINLIDLEKKLFLEESHHFLQAKHYIFHLDLNNSLLYSMNRHVKNLLSECAFDLLFRQVLKEISE